MYDHLCEQVCQQCEDRDAAPTAAGKKINGRKRFIVTDTAGLLFTVAGLTASWQDRDGGKTALLGTYLSSPVRHVFADQGFAGRFVDWARDTLKTTVEIVRKPAEQRGFAVQPRRWVVERTLAWLTTHRRLAVTTNATSRPPKPSSAGPPSTACYAGSPADNPPDANCAAPSPGPDQHLKHSLSDREREVLLLLAQGLSNTDISAQLFITESTVKSHLSSILVNLECQNRVQAAHLVYRAGLLR